MAMLRQTMKEAQHPALDDGVFCSDPGAAFAASFNEALVMAITQAVCVYRCAPVQQHGGLSKFRT
jgi:hypothetical protein